jgi:hypothetical protein
MGDLLKESISILANIFPKLIQQHTRSFCIKSYS